MSKTLVTRIGYVAILTASLVLVSTPLATRLDNLLLDVGFRMLRAVVEPVSTPDVVVVGIDEESFRSFREPLALWHHHLGSLMEALAGPKPAAVGLDVVLPDRSYAFISLDYDAALAGGVLRLGRATKLVLAQTLDERGELRPLFAPIVSIAGPEHLGLAIVIPDEDGTVRRIRSELVTDSGVFPTLSGRMAALLGRESDPGIIDYTRGAPYAYIPMQRVIDWQARGETAELESSFAGKIVLVGAVLPFEDRHHVPVPLAAWEPGNTYLPGVLVHAQALRSMLGSGLIRPVATGWVVALVIAGTLFWWWEARARLAVLGLALYTATILAVFLAGLVNGMHWPVSTAILAAAVGAGGRVVLEGAFAFRDRRRLRQSFGPYVSPNVLAEILSGRIKPGMGGELRRVCVLFSDIRNFTTRSESSLPETIITLLNDYFSEMTACVHRYGGTVDKFMGDGLMAFFGAPNAVENPPKAAFDAAREMLARLDNLNERLSRRAVEPVEIGIGLQVGDAVVGHVGSGDRHEYTVIGDVVNTASRLEGLTKELGYLLVMSSDVAESLGPAHELTDLGVQVVKGRSPVAVYGWQPTGHLSPGEASPFATVVSASSPSDLRCV